MTSQPPTPPPGITARPPATLAEIAAATAGLIAEARAAGLAPPCALNANDYGPPTANLYVSEHDTPDIWQALQQWADRYGTEITTRPSTSPGAVYASASFRRDGISYEVYCIIYPARRDDAGPATRDQAA
jgi:hypothetical protein